MDVVKYNKLDVVQKSVIISVDEKHDTPRKNHTLFILLISCPTAGYVKKMVYLQTLVFLIDMLLREKWSHVEGYDNVMFA